MTRSGLALLFHGPGQPLEPRLLEIPEPSGAEILTKVVACTLCGSDLHTFTGRRAGPSPAILGHEILGRIECFGPDAPRTDARGLPLQARDRILWSLVASCGSCFYCSRGLPQKCLSAFKYGHERLEPGAPPRGGLSEFCSIVPGTTVLKLPDTLPDSVACPAGCATATVAALFDHAPHPRNRSVLILGAGTLGLTSAAMARDRGAAEVLVCDLHPRRLEKALDFGATGVALPADLPSLVRQTTGFGVDLAIDLAGTPPAFELALTSLRLGGWLGLAGAVFPSPPVPLAIDRLVRHQISLSGIHNYAPRHLLDALDFLQTTPYPMSSLLTHWLPLEHAAEAFALAADPHSLRVGLRP